MPLSFKVFILSGALAGLTGWMIAARTNGATPTVATGFLFETLAAVIIGGVSMTGGVGSLPGVIGGVLLLSSIHSASEYPGDFPFCDRSGKRTAGADRDRTG